MLLKIGAEKGRKYLIMLRAAFFGPSNDGRFIFIYLDV